MYTVGVVNRRQFKDGEDIIERGFREFLCIRSVRYVQSWATSASVDYAFVSSRKMP